MQTRSTFLAFVLLHLCNFTRESKWNEETDCAGAFGANLGFCENPWDGRGRCYLGMSVCDSASVLFCLTTGAWRTEDIFPLIRDDVERLFVSNWHVFSKKPKMLMWKLIFFFIIYLRITVPLSNSFIWVWKGVWVWSPSWEPWTKLVVEGQSWRTEQCVVS